MVRGFQQRIYTVGINVQSADELASIGTKLNAFILEVGDGTLDVQLAINPLGNSDDTPANAIGFATDGFEYYEDDDDEMEDE